MTNGKYIKTLNDTSKLIIDLKDNEPDITCAHKYIHPDKSEYFYSDIGKKFSCSCCR